MKDIAVQESAERPAATSLLLPAALLAFGIASFIIGAALAWGERPLVGFAIGSAGTAALVVGAILARIRLVGRFMDAEEGTR